MMVGLKSSNMGSWLFLHHISPCKKNGEYMLRSKQDKEEKETIGRI